MQAGADAVQQTAFLGAVAAEVYEYLVGTVIFTPFTCFMFGIFTEDYLCRCVNLKMIHNISSLPVIIYHCLKGNKRITKRLPEVAGSLSQKQNPERTDIQLSGISLTLLIIGNYFFFVNLF